MLAMLFRGNVFNMIVIINQR